MSAEGAQRAKRVTLGRISGLYGVKGWVKVHSYTDPRENIVGFSSWILEHGGEQHRIDVEAGRSQGKNIVAKLHGIDDRDQAQEWIGAEIAVDRDELPPCAPGEYYWVDLEGLAVHDMQGEVLGEVDHLMATGANDVIVLRGDAQRLIPFVADTVVKRIDFEGGVIVVDWEPGFWEP